MFDPFKILSHSLIGNQVIVVGVLGNDQSETVVQAIWVTKLKSDVQMGSSKAYDSLATFSNDLEVRDSEMPIVLVINDVHVILEQKPEAIAVFESDEFIIQKSVDADLFGVIRKSQVEKYLESMDTLRSRVIDVYLGPVASFDWAASLNMSYPVYLGNHEINIEDSKPVLSRSIKPENLMLDERLFTPDQLLLFLTSFGLMVNKSVNGSWQESNVNFREYIFKILYTKCLLIGGLSLLVIFLTSSVLFFYYQKENEKLGESFYEQNILQKKTTFYQQEIVRLQEVLNTDSRYPVFSRISNDLAAPAPATISLKGMAIHPTHLAEMKRTKSVQSQDVVTLVGQSHSMKEVSAWVASIKDLKWVQDITKNEIDKVEGGYLINLTLQVRHVE